MKKSTKTPAERIATVEKAVRARVDGREAVAKRTVWSLEIGPVRARCLWRGRDFVVQIRGPKGWNPEVGHGKDALALLRTVTRSKGLEDALAEKVSSL